MTNQGNLVETISLELGAQETWPNDVKLFQPYAVEQILLPDNANCLAVQAYLHMCGLPFQIEHRANSEFMSPSGKVPFIKYGAFVISELEPIVQFIANKGITLTEDLDREEKADMRAYMSIIHTVLVNAELYICWCDKKTFNEVTQIRNGSVYPWPLNHVHTWSKRNAVIRWLKIHGWYQKTIEGVYEEVEICCKALSERLEGKDYFFGDNPTELDALLYGHIYAILSSSLQTCNLTEKILMYPNLRKHCKTICLKYMHHTRLIFTEKPMSPNTNAHRCFSEERKKNKKNHNSVKLPENLMSNLNVLCEETVSTTNTSTEQTDDYEIHNVLNISINCHGDEIGYNMKRTESKVNCTIEDNQESNVNLNLESSNDWGVPEPFMSM